MQAPHCRIFINSSEHAFIFFHWHFSVFRIDLKYGSFLGLTAKKRELNTFFEEMMLLDFGLYP
jgi:hypothetical protein